MPIRRAFAALLLLPPLLAAAPSLRAQVEASLVAADAGVSPGRPLTVALRLEHAPHWHSYWINPGTGYATSLEWSLPPGWSAGPIQWPAPHVVRDTKGDITGNGYEDVVLLPVTLTPPADLKPGETVTLSAKAAWLMCAETCVPGQREVALTLSVVEGEPAPSPHAAEVAAALKQLPRSLPAWSVTVSRGGDTLKLRLAGPADAPAPEKPWVFAHQDLVRYDAPQTVKADGPGAWVFTLAVSDYATATDRLSGVITSANGWAGGAPGLAFDAAIGTDAATGFVVTRATAEGAEPVNGFGGTLLLALAGGLILNLMPCVFPVLGIKILGFVNQSGQDRRKVKLHGVAFSAGVLASFWALAGVLIALRSGGRELGWGFQLQDPAFVFVMTALLLVFALSMSGVFEFGLSATSVGAGLQSRGGYRGSFFTGVLATVVATPCSAPFLAPALGAALALPAGPSFTLFTAIAIGLSLPYLLLSLFPDAVKALPRPGAWMETFKQAMAFPLYGTVGYLVWVLAGQVSEYGLLNVLVGLTLIAMAVWLYGRYTQPGAKATRRRIGVIGGLLLLAGGLALGWPRAAAPTDLVWEPWSAERVAELRAEGRPVYVDFTARWCFTCQTNKKVVFGSSEVLKRFRERNVATLRADWTNHDPKITAELARWDRAAVPFNLLYLPGRDEPVVLPELLTPGVVLDALE